MPNPAPTPGCCNAKLSRQRGYCRNKDLRNNGRCKFHGGHTTGPKTPEGKAKSSQNSVVHGLTGYAKALRAAMRSKDKKLFDIAPRGTDLSDEIACLRVDLVRYETMLADVGIDATIEGRADGNGIPARIPVVDLRDRARSLLNSMVHNQHNMHPEAAKSGHLKITVEVAGSALALDVGNLEAGGGAKQLSESVQTEVEDAEIVEDNPLAELEDDE